MAKEEAKSTEPKGVVLYAADWPPRVVETSYTGPVRADGKVKHPVHGWCYVDASRKA